MRGTTVTVRQLPLAGAADFRSVSSDVPSFPGVRERVRTISC